MLYVITLISNITLCPVGLVSGHAISQQATNSSPSWPPSNLNKRMQQSRQQGVLSTMNTLGKLQGDDSVARVSRRIIVY